MPDNMAAKARTPLTLKQLTTFDDQCTDALVDRVYYWTKILKNRSKFFASRGIKEDDVAGILRKWVIEEKNLAMAEAELLKLGGLKSFVNKLNTVQERDDFRKHLRRYIALYLPDCSIEVNTSNRYTLFEHEASITARKMIGRSMPIKYLVGVQVPMTAEEEEDMDLKRKDFSIVITSRKKVPSVFLGPARFANHDCNPNADLQPLSNNGMSIVALRDIHIGEEVTVHYGDNYFGVDNCECLCRTCENLLRNGWAPRDCEGHMIPQIPVDLDEFMLDGKYISRRTRRSGVLPEFTRHESSSAEHLLAPGPRGMKRKRGSMTAAQPPTSRAQRSDREMVDASVPMRDGIAANQIFHGEIEGAIEPSTTPINLIALDVKIVNAKLQDFIAGGSVVQARECPTASQDTHDKDVLLLEPPTPSLIHTPWDPQLGFLKQEQSSTGLDKIVSQLDDKSQPFSGPKSLHRTIDRASSIEATASHPSSNASLGLVTDTPPSSVDAFSDGLLLKSSLEGQLYEQIDHRTINVSTPSIPESSSNAHGYPIIDPTHINDKMTEDAERHLQGYAPLNEQLVPAMEDCPVSHPRDPTPAPSHESHLPEHAPSTYTESPWTTSTEQHVPLTTEKGALPKPLTKESSSQPEPLIRRPRDYHLNPDLLPDIDATYIRCLNPTCIAGPINHPPSSDYGWFVCRDARNAYHGEKSACPRCERHFKLYGFYWPKTDPDRVKVRKGKDGERIRDEVEERLDWRTVEMFRGRRVWEGSGGAKWWFKRDEKGLGGRSVSRGSREGSSKTRRRTEGSAVPTTRKSRLSYRCDEEIDDIP